jgi:hypothetical protein
MAAAAMAAGPTQQAPDDFEAGLETLQDWMISQG